MRRFDSRQAYDEEPFPQLHSEAVDFRAASEWFAPKRKLRRGDLDTLGLVVRDQAPKVPWGSGMQRMMAACDEAGRPHPVFEELGGRFRVTLRVSSPGVQTDDVDARLLGALQAQDGLSTSQLAATIKTYRSHDARTRLKRLVERGQVREVGSGANDPRRRYYLMD